MYLLFKRKHGFLHIPSLQGGEVLGGKDCMAFCKKLAGACNLASVSSHIQCELLLCLQ